MTASIDSTALGARHDGQCVTFGLYSSVATAVELCCFDTHDRQISQHALQAQGDGLWSLRLPDCAPGQRYGYRVHGPYEPAAGLRCNPHKLLIDPYARQLDGEFVWHRAVHGYAGNNPHDGSACTLDSAPYVPKSVVTGAVPALQHAAPRIPWADTVICELNVRGYTMRCPDLSATERGRFAGLANGKILQHLRALGITSIELLPVHAFIDEQFLVARGLRNYWGYNSVSFFAPAGRYGNTDPVAEFRSMTDAIHDAGMEIVLDVVYNHTGETDEYGPTLSFRGLDNQAYYRTRADAPHAYLNDTGCGNMLNADHPQVQALVLSSLEYWHKDMGVDGFRFDLAPVLGRHASGFTAAHPLLQAIEQSKVLRHAKLIAEPWDIGPGGYQLGQFGPRWGEWNDQYRDTVRRFWRGDEGQAGAFAKVLHGSAPLFEHKASGPVASINFVASHDGFTLADTVSYADRHNEANGQDNTDGHTHNFSCNHGHEGPTDNAAINAMRRQQRLNMLATLMVSGGTPMLLGGDEFGHSQLGNNNAYAQDNEIAWLDWSGLTEDPQFSARLSEWAELRRQQPLLRPAVYKHGAVDANGVPDIIWLRPDGAVMETNDWALARSFAMVLSHGSALETADRAENESTAGRIAVLFNAAPAQVDFVLPHAHNIWQLRLATTAVIVKDNACSLAAHSIAVLYTNV